MSVKSLNSETVELLKDNFDSVRSNIERVSGEKKVTLLAATKTVDVEIINYAIDNLELTDIGENRVQELIEKYDALHKNNVNLHFIGRLQTNKVKYIIDKVCLIHSLDSERLALEIEKQASKHGLVMDVLIEVNIANEASKGGILPSDAPRFLAFVDSLEHVNCKGVMVIPPDCKDDDVYTQYFEKTTELSKELFGSREYVISMGMTDSYIPAVKCGSDIVRIGSGLFGKRNYNI